MTATVPRGKVLCCRTRNDVKAFGGGTKIEANMFDRGVLLDDGGEVLVPDPTGENIVIRNTDGGWCTRGAFEPFKPPAEERQREARRTLKWIEEIGVHPMISQYLLRLCKPRFVRPVLYWYVLALEQFTHHRERAVAAAVSGILSTCSNEQRIDYVLEGLGLPRQTWRLGEGQMRPVLEAVLKLARNNLARLEGCELPIRFYIMVLK